MKNVTVANYVRAESDHMIRANMKMVGVGFGQFTHLRAPTTPENQPVIRMNQDTLYSATVLDLSEPVAITLPEVNGRYMSMHVVNQDHYMFVEARPGTYELTEETVGTRFAYVTIRTFYNAGNPEDLQMAHAAQDKLEITGGGDGPFDADRLSHTSGRATTVVSYPSTSAPRCSLTTRGTRPAGGWPAARSRSTCRPLCRTGSDSRRHGSAIRHCRAA